MWAARVSIAFLMAATPLAAKQYQPDTREALLIRPHSPAQRVLPPVRCLSPIQATKIVSFSIRDKAGKIVATGSFEVREEC